MHVVALLPPNFVYFFHYILFVCVKLMLYVSINNTKNMIDCLENSILQDLWPIYPYTSATRPTKCHFAATMKAMLVSTRQ